MKGHKSLKDSVVMITGGTGTFGTAFFEKCISEYVREVRVFSRDEKKQYDMAHRYRQYKNVRFFIGDVRNPESLEYAMQGVDYCFHAAAMKQVPSCEEFPMEAVKTNVIGSGNVLDAAIRNGVKKVVVLSTDKAVYPTSAMGITKACMEKLALQKAAIQGNTEICITRFGNLVASRGSAVPVFLEQAKNGLPITITDPEMTRFMMTVWEAVELVKEAFEKGTNGDLMVKLAKSCTTGDLVSAIYKYMHLPNYYPTEVIGRREGEKMHEALLSEEEAALATLRDGFAVINRLKMYRDPEARPVDHSVFCSDKAERMEEKQILKMIELVYKGGTC